MSRPWKTYIACSRRSDSGQCREGREREKKIRWKRGRGREKGTPVRFVFKRSFRPLCRLVIRMQFPVLKVVNQATGDKTHCLLKKYACIHLLYLFSANRINPSLQK